KRTLHVDARQNEVGGLVVFLVVQLEPRLIDHLAVEDGGLGRLNRMIGIERVDAARGQVEITDALILNVVARITVAQGQGVVLAELIIQTRADTQPILRRLYNLIKRRALRVRARNESIHDAPAINIAIEHIQEKRSLLA